MPVITVEGPGIPDLGTRRRLVEDFTTAAADAFGLGRETIVVILHETSPECVASGGELICDRQAAAQASAE